MVAALELPLWWMNGAFVDLRCTNAPFIADCGQRLFA
jgi:hypothetical protein